jgi:type II restriction/modification system DNA methylase subunit YeeA
MGTELWKENLKSWNDFEDLAKGGRKIVKWTLRGKFMEWLNLAQGRDKWRALEYGHEHSSFINVRIFYIVTRQNDCRQIFD